MQQGGWSSMILEDPFQPKPLYDSVILCDTALFVRLWALHEDTDPCAFCDGWVMRNLP